MPHRKACKHCGGTEESHHDYEPTMPEGCVCNPLEWGDVVTDICTEYKASADDYCLCCEHDEECHKGPKAPSPTPGSAD